MVSPRILLIDDDRELRDLLKAGLEVFGNFRVVCAPDGETGVLLARKEPPDVLVIDLIMPGLDGEQVINKLRQEKRFHAIPTYLLTATPELGNALQIGSVEVVEKPVDIDRLVEKIKGHLEDLERAKKLRESARRQSREMALLERLLEAPEQGTG